MGTKLTPDEQETICRYSRADKRWYVYTDLESHRRKFARLGWPPDPTLPGGFLPPEGAMSFRRGRSIARIQAGKEKGVRKLGPPRGRAQKRR